MREGRCGAAVLVFGLLAALGTGHEALSAAGTESYTYDALGRLTQVTFPDGTSTTYSYDAAGNRKTYQSPAVSTYTDTATMTEGTYSSGPVTFYGWYTGYAGSMSPTALTGGKTMTDFYEEYVYGSYQYSIFHVSGFSSDPGASWLVSLAANGTTHTGITATYSYSSGLASWTWSATPFSLQSSGTVVCTIVHR